MSDDWAYHATVGVPTPCTELRFESVPDMNYDALSAEGPRGEILLRGPPTFTGYYKNEKGRGSWLAGVGWVDLDAQQQQEASAWHVARVWRVAADALAAVAVAARLWVPHHHPAPFPAPCTSACYTGCARMTLSAD
jgi:hypothetical protein